MSRYSKSYGRGSKHGGAGLRFDTLLKACSNSKKPSANKTAGALGRFGIASFTSTRNTSLDNSGEEESRFSFAKKRAKLSSTTGNSVAPTDPYHLGNSQKPTILLQHQASSYPPVTPVVSAAPVYKPRKFFKSRGPMEVDEAAAPIVTKPLRPEITSLIAPIKIPIPKPAKPKVKSQSPEKSSKPLRNANSASPPNSQPIKLRIFKDKTTSKLVSVSEAAPPTLESEYQLNQNKSNKPEKIPKKRGRKPKNLTVNTVDIPLKTYEPPPVIEKKPAGRLTRNSRKHHQEEQEQEQQKPHLQPLLLHLHRNSDSSIEAMPILSRAQSRDSEENVTSENSSAAYSPIFRNNSNNSQTVSISTPGRSDRVGLNSSFGTSSANNANVVIERKLEDDAEFQQLSQMLSSMEDEVDGGNFNNNEGYYPSQQQSQHSHQPQQQFQQLHHQQLQQLQIQPPQQSPQQQPSQPHQQYNSQVYSEFQQDSLSSMVSPVGESRPINNMIQSMLQSPTPPIPSPPKKVRDAQDIRAILEDDWDESFDEESPKKSPPKTSRFDLSAFMPDGSQSSTSSSPPNHLLQPQQHHQQFVSSFAGQAPVSIIPADMTTTNYSPAHSQPQQYHHQQYQQSTSSHSHFPDGQPQQPLQFASPFNAPYAVRNLLSNPADFQPNTNFAHSSSEVTTVGVSMPPGHAHHEVSGSKAEAADTDKFVALNLTTTTPVVVPPAVRQPTQVSTKKGSIFKSRSLAQSSGENGKEGSQGNPKKRLALYKHKFGQGDGDDDGDNHRSVEDHHKGAPANFSAEDFDEDSDAEDLASMRRVVNSDGSNGGDGSSQKVMCRKNAKKLYSVIRNVKPIHELQESGEFHEFDGDVWYILEELKDKNLMTNRCLSAITLATRCMEPAFRMHLRAHGTVAEFCKELHDAPNNPILALLASTVLFVLSQDRLNMDLDTVSLKLIIALTKAEEEANLLDESPEIGKLRQRVYDLVSEMKQRGHAKHLKVEKITASELALETLLYLTSKRAGEWVKHELRTLGGLDYIVTEVVTSLQWLQRELVSGVGFSEGVIERLWKIDRCLRVLQQVTFNHEENQRYLLGISKGVKDEAGKLAGTPEIFIILFRFCSDQLSGLPKDVESAKVLQEILFSVLRVLVNLSHDYRGIVLGSEILCALDGFLPLCLHSVFHMSVNIPDEKIFDLLMHSLCMLLNLVEHSRVNRTAILTSTVRRSGASLSLHGGHSSSWSSDDSGLEEEQPTLDALVEMFVAKEKAAKKEEASTDDILTKGSDSQQKEKDSQKNSQNSQNSQNTQNSQESESSNSVQDTIDKLIQTAGKHMENSLIAAYVSLLLAYLIMDDTAAAETVRNSMPSCKYLPLMIVLKKLFNFMSITSSASGSLRGLKATAIALKFYAKCDPQSNEELKKIIPD